MLKNIHTIRKVIMSKSTTFVHEVTIPNCINKAIFAPEKRAVQKRAIYIALFYICLIF